MKSLRSKSMLLASVLIFCVSTSAICAPAGYFKIWEDTFSGGSLDTSNWTIGMRDPGTSDLVPGAAGRYYHNTSYANYITAEDVWVSGGNLYLQNQKRTYVGTDPAGTYDYTSGWIMSMHKVHFNKGYVEMRAQFPSGDKVWPALWMCAEDLIWGPEWDMFEYFGYRPDRGYDVMMMNLAYDPWPNIGWKGKTLYNYDTNYDCETWHIYGFEWTESYAKFFIDGNEVYHMDNDIGSSWPDEEMYIILNNGVRTGSPDTTTIWPNNVIIDYIELYQSDSGPIAHWKFDETSGDIAHDLVGKNDGTLYGNPVWYPSGGQIDGGLEFDGIDDYVEMDITNYKGVIGRKSRTCAAWVKTTGTGAIVSWGKSGTAGQWWLFRVNDTGRLHLQAHIGRIIGNTDLRDGEWHHVAAILANDGTPDNSEVKLYVDGVEETYSEIDSQPINTASHSNVTIGASYLYNGTVVVPFTGLIDDVRIYGTVLSESEIQSLAGMGN